MRNNLRFQIFVVVLSAAFALSGTFVRGDEMGKANHVAASLHQRYDLTGETIGLAGYDPVAYFPEGGGKPVKGSIKISYDYDGVTYRFASQEHLDLFKKNPEKFVPAYGGWCAWAVPALGKRVDVDPESFQVKNGKLYVFYRDPSLDTRSLWLKDPDGFIAKGESKWVELSHQ
jgi:YHS domain-containing protein